MANELQTLAGQIAGFLGGFGKPQQGLVSPLPKYPAGEDQAVQGIIKQAPGYKKVPEDLMHQLFYDHGTSLIPNKNPLQQIAQAISHFNPAPAHAQAQTQLPTETPAPTIDPNKVVPSGVDLAMNFLKQQTPGGQDPKQYFKALQNPDFMNKIQSADKTKPGLGNALLLQGFYESTLGNSGNNIFGVLPGGEGSGRSAEFSSPSDAVDYQLGPNVLGGGANPQMDILHQKGPLTLGQLQQMYQHYNPEGAYIQPMMKTLTGN